MTDLTYSLHDKIQRALLEGMRDEFMAAYEEFSDASLGLSLALATTGMGMRVQDQPEALRPVVASALDPMRQMTKMLHRITVELRHDDPLNVARRLIETMPVVAAAFAMKFPPRPDDDA